ncbi:MAG: c-type cytochrome [Gammaproteobacteria bacterium]
MQSNKLPLSLALMLSWFVCVPTSAADLKAGEQKAQTCVGCHGANGNSSNAQFPILAGQQPAYLATQLKNFKEGARENPMMSGMAAGLSDDDIENLAAYFANQTSQSAGGDPALAKQGKSKFNMCMGCHGQEAKGNGQFPRLAGQHPEYIAKQLKNFKEGTRKGGPMRAIANNLTDEDMEALAAYLGSL